jgi:hypothetical protein
MCEAKHYNICRFRVQEMKDDLESTESAWVLVLLVVAQAVCWLIEMCWVACAWTC